VLIDLKTEDAKEQEAWVSGGDSADLQALINDAGGASGSDPLDSAAQTFNTDVSAYLSDNSHTSRLGGRPAITKCAKT
jgi:hypothetical protein